MNSIFLLFILYLVTNNNNVFSYRVKTDKDAVEYLTYYGYVDPKEMPAGFTLQDCNKKLKEFQKFARVDVTGKLDTSTMKAMNSPRCGCPDFIHLSFKNDDGKLSNHSTSSSHNHTPFHRHKHHPYHPHHDDHYHRNSTNRNSSRNQRSNRRTKRYVLSERQWNKEVVTYNIVKYPSRRDLQVSTTDIEDTLHKAFQIWEQHINLKFGYRPNDIDVDIEISFNSAYHGDGYPHDGPGNTLAHAFFPGTGLGGDVHFEEDEDWRVNSPSGIDLLYVAVHEIGHSLGLGHSSYYEAIMYPMYRGFERNLQLHSDDIRGVQAMYGRPIHNFPRTSSTTTATTTTPHPTTTVTTTVRSRYNVTTVRPTYPSERENDNDLCEDTNFDGITTMLGDAILMFRGPSVYELGKSGEGVLPGWPKEISSYFRGLPETIDCVITRSNGKTYFFKGKQYWRFTGRQMDRGYPRLISEYFPGVPNYLDAAFEWDDEFVFIKGDYFWRFNTRKRPQVQPYFPMPISHWGLDFGINAAFTAPNRSVYFFQGPYFWEFDKITHKVTRSYAKASLISERWFGCLEEP